MKTYDLRSVWNGSLEKRTERELKPRDHIWASELGKAPLDIWLKMRAEPPTNPPDTRALRKFEAGNVMEWIVSLVLRRVGVLQATQLRCVHQYEGLLEVTGNMDMLFGGRAEVAPHLADLNLPDVFIRAGREVCDSINREFPKGLPKCPLEIKSCGARLFDRYAANGTASKNHRMQLFHYLKAHKMEHGELIYICRDDLRMHSFSLFNPGTTEEDYRWHIAEITDYHRGGAEPPKEKCIVFDGDQGKFTANWQVGYSSYLTRNFPQYANQSAFDNHNKPIVGRWNRVLGRMAKGEKMTKNNDEAITEMRAAGFDAAALLKEFNASQEEAEQ